MSQIHLRKVSKYYGSVRALEETQLSFSDNATTAIIGPSGCGKSTLLKLINGLERPTRGSVEVFGAPIHYKQLASLRRRIGYAVQGTGLFPHMTAGENITLLARLLAWERDRIQARLEELIDLVELRRDAIHRYPHELSGGQQQRVGLCRAMMLDPKLLLLDEPFGALDPITKNEIHEEMLRIQAQANRTIVMVTHDLHEAMKLASEIVIMQKGNVLQHGSCEEVVQNPQHGFVKEFLETQLNA